MCGIAGIFGVNGSPVEAREVQSMCDAIVHRGPNDEGYFVHGAIGLGMRRLSIIDLSTGRQPVHNEDGSVQVVLNGEIYNFRELRQDLEARGHSFYTRTDTEVIVHLYEEYGADCVKHLRGMFAFALWDANNRTLLLARDRLGIKPLFYGEFNGRLIFASELKALLQLSAVKRELNLASVGYLFSFMTTPPDESVVSGVHKLEPGNLLLARAGQVPRVIRYWDVRFETDYKQTENDCIDRLRSLLKESVRLRLVSDVPLGAFLSGGIDSSAVVASMAEQCSAPVKTFSIGFSDAAYNEAPHAKQVAEAFGTDHHELILEPNVTDMLDDLAWYLDEPFGDSSAIPTYMVSKLAAEYVTVALSGDGGDELFAGYDKYLVERKERTRHNIIPAALRRMVGVFGDRMTEGARGRNFLRHLALDGSDRYVDANSLFKRDERKGLFCDEAGAAVMATDRWGARYERFDREEGHWLSKVQYVDIHNYLPLDILTKVDRMSMAHSLEARVPLLDHKLVEYAATIPPEYRLKGGDTKFIFKKAMRGILPDAIIDRRKQGFAVPLESWFRSELSSKAHDLLMSDTCRSRNLFNQAYIGNMLARYRNGESQRLNSRLWTLISFELWCRKFLDEPAIRAGEQSSDEQENAWRFSAA